MRYEKLSPALAAAVDDYERAGRPGLGAHRRSMALVTAEAAVKPARVVVFLHTAAEADLDHLHDLGVEVNDASGTVRTAIVPMERLDALSEDPAIHRIVPSRPLKPLLDVATGVVNVPAFRTRTGLTGKGVVVGVVDSGVEVTHDSFSGRIARLWDQTLHGRGVPEGRYGAELKGSTLEQSRDTDGHGTHVAGIAAGADDEFGGVAPGATLVVVKTDMQTAHVVDGVRYVFRVASELGLPAVVNLSLGGQDDSHDGTDSVSMALDHASGPGRIVCCAAGNDGNENIHAQVALRKGGTRTVACSVGSPVAGDPPLVASFTGWYAGSDELAVAVVSPSDRQTPFQPVLGSGSPVRSYTLAEGTVRVVTPGPDPANGDHNFVVQIQPVAPAPGAPAPRGGWRLRLKGTKVQDGTVHLWSVDGLAAHFTGAAVVDSTKVGAPGAATAAITVASYTTRTSWEDIWGRPHEAGLDLHDVSDFSSEGPRRDGFHKPDLAAPGAMIVSALSVHSGVVPEQVIDGLHTIKAGTSMAAPFVSGLVALLLERDGSLGPEPVRDLLRRHCAIPGRPVEGPSGERGTARTTEVAAPSSVWDPKWGSGLIDARTL